MGVTLLHTTLANKSTSISRTHCSEETKEVGSDDTPTRGIDYSLGYHTVQLMAQDIYMRCSLTLRLRGMEEDGKQNSPHPKQGLETLTTCQQSPDAFPSIVSSHFRNLHNPSPLRAFYQRPM